MCKAIQVLMSEGIKRALVQATNIIKLKGTMARLFLFASVIILGFVSVRQNETLSTIVLYVHMY